MSRYSFCREEASSRCVYTHWMIKSWGGMKVCKVVGISTNQIWWQCYQLITGNICLSEIPALSWTLMPGLLFVREPQRTDSGVINLLFPQGDALGKTKNITIFHFEVCRRTVKDKWQMKQSDDKWFDEIDILTFSILST